MRRRPTGLQRTMLAVAIPMAGALAILPGAAVGVLAGLPELVTNVMAFAMVPVAVALAAKVAPRVMPPAAFYSTWRLFLAGCCGLVLAVLVSRALNSLGVDSEALSSLQAGATNLDALWAAAQEVAALVGFYGTLTLAAFGVLSVRSPV